MSSIGKSAAWRDVLRRAALVAPAEATVLIQGETGISTLESRIRSLGINKYEFMSAY